MAQVEETKSDTMGLAKTLLQNVREMRKGIEHKTIQAKIKEGNERPKIIKTEPKIRLDKKVKKAITDQMKSEKPKKSENPEKSSSSKKQLQNGGQKIPRDKSDDGLKAPSSPTKKSSSNNASKVQNSKEKKTTSKSSTDTKKSSKASKKEGGAAAAKKSGSKNLISYEKFVENTDEPKIVITNPTNPDLESLGNGGLEGEEKSENSKNDGSPTKSNKSEKPPPSPSKKSIGASSGNSSPKKSPSKARIAKSQSQSKFNSMPSRDAGGVDSSGRTSPKRSIKRNVSESNLPVQDARFTIQDWPERPPPHERKQGTIIYPKDISEDAVPFTYSPPGKNLFFYDMYFLFPSEIFLYNFPIFKSCNATILSPFF